MTNKCTNYSQPKRHKDVKRQNYYKKQSHRNYVVYTCLKVDYYTSRLLIKQDARNEIIPGLLLLCNKLCIGHNLNLGAFSA